MCFHWQVANAKLEGGTLVVASGEDDQQCVFVTEDGHQVMQRTNEDGSTVLTLESAYADAVAQLVPNQVNICFSYTSHKMDSLISTIQVHVCW